MSNSPRKSAKSSNSKGQPSVSVVVRLTLSRSSRAAVHVSTPERITFDSDRSFKAGKDL